MLLLFLVADPTASHDTYQGCSCTFRALRAPSHKSEVNSRSGGSRVLPLSRLALTGSTHAVIPWFHIVSCLGKFSDVAYTRTTVGQNYCGSLHTSLLVHHNVDLCLFFTCPCLAYNRVAAHIVKGYDCVLNNLAAKRGTTWHRPRSKADVWKIHLLHACEDRNVGR